MVVDHRKSVADCIFKELVVNEYYEQVYNSDFLWVCCCYSRTVRFSLAVSVSRCALIKKYPVLLDGFNYRFICIQYTNFMLLQKIACIAASDCSASYKSNSHKSSLNLTDSSWCFFDFVGIVLDFVIYLSYVLCLTYDTCNISLCLTKVKPFFQKIKK